jgi:hypothetical protein
VHPDRTASPTHHVDPRGYYWALPSVWVIGIYVDVHRHGVRRVNRSDHYAAAVWAFFDRHSLAWIRTALRLKPEALKLPAGFEFGMLWCAFECMYGASAMRSDGVPTPHARGFVEIGDAE